MGAAGPMSLLPYLGSACRDARLKAGRLQIHIAVELGAKSEATVRRFERGQHWPQHPDAMVQAYARDLGLEPIDIWREALKRWEADTG